MQTVTRFDELPLLDPLRRAVAEKGYTTPTPIQAAAIPHLLNGRDLLGCAQTGTGKTAAFALPILQRLANNIPAPGARRSIRALILTPTRELAIQIGDSFHAYSRHLKLSTAVVLGGVGKGPQAQALRRGVDILVATPGRLLDHLSDRVADLTRLEVFVLDEADRMLDMGFIHDVKRIIQALPAKRQSLFFSATMPAEAAALANTLLTNPVKVAVAPPSTPAERIRQTLYFVERRDKSALLGRLLKDAATERTLVFTRTKHGASRLARHLSGYGIEVDAIHGDRPQNARQRALESFRRGKLRVLVATDIASRGIDVDDISHVVNFDLPGEPEVYIHRIGRTARAGKSGVALSLCDGEERDYLRDIEKKMGMAIPVERNHPHHSGEAEAGRVNGVSGVQSRKERVRRNSEERSARRQGERCPSHREAAPTRSSPSPHAPVSSSPSAARPSLPGANRPANRRRRPAKRPANSPARP